MGMEVLFMETSKFSLLQLIRKMILIIVLSLLFVALLFYLITHEAKFQQTYQSVIQRKYDHLMNTDERKIIIVGGSSTAFGIDAEYLEKMTGLKVVNLGLHAGFGNLFNTEIMKGNINSGDIVLLGYEYTLYTDCFEKLGDVNLIQQAIDNRIDMYSIIPVRNYPDVVGNIFQFAKSKYQGDYNVSGTYSSFSFDENGNMIPYMPSADYIIVDEIQDFSDEEIKDFLNATHKNFFFFGDTAQSIFEGFKTTLPVDRISSIVPLNMKVKNWELYRNYRLPLPVARVVQSVGVDLPPFIESTYKSKETAVPRFLKYSDEDSQIKAIHDIIAKNNMTDVAILLPDNDYVKSVYDKLRAMGGNYELRYNDKEDFRNSQDNLNFTSTNPKVMTYHSAKGLQFETVFLPYIENFSGNESDRKALYVAMTRTYRDLYVMYTSALPSPLTEINPDLYKTTEIDEIEDL